MTANMVSTKEVAAMLHVTETTIKRWADEAVLSCIKTAGGHRKFLLKDIMSFAESNGYTISGSHPPPMSQRQMEQLQTGVYTQNYAKVAHVLKEEVLQADREGLATLLLYLYKQHIPLPVVLDEVIRPSFDEIGREWENGSLGVDKEHEASHAIAEALLRTAPELHRKEPNRKSAVCACPEGELHELGLRGLAYSLECEGWKVHYLGGNTPLDTLNSFVSATEPNLVCLSLTSVRLRGNILEKFKKLASTVHSYKGRLVVGGYYARNLRRDDLRCDHVAVSIQDAIAYTRDVFQLKPGPKKTAIRRVEHHT